MIFVLGLGHKLRNIPIVTIFIIVLCTLYYFSFQSRDQVYKDIAENNVSVIESIEFEKLFEEFLVNENVDKVDFALNRKVIKSFSQTLRKELGGEIEVKDPKQKNPRINSPEEPRIHLLIKFTKDLKEKNPKVVSLLSYNDYKALLDNKNLELIEIHKKYNLLSNHNNHLVSAVVAMFSHGSILHLMGNMIFLFFFGRYVEQRYGHLVYFLLYFLAGMVALMAYAAIQGEDSFINVLGASANVSVILGAFFCSFYHHRMKIYVWYFFIGKVVQISIKKYFVFLFIIQDVVLSLVGSTNVAHMAHVNGLIFGAVFAYFWIKKFNFPKEFLYPFELKDWKKVVNLTGPDYYLKVSKLLEYNPDNKIIKSEVRKHIFNSIQGTKKLTKEMHKNLIYLIPDYIVQHIKGESGPKTSEFYAYMNHMSSKYMVRYLKGINQRELLFLIDESLDREEYFLSIQFIHSFYIKYPRSGKLINLGKTLNSILENKSHISRIQRLLDLLHHDSTSKKFKKIIHKYIFTKDEES